MNRTITRAQADDWGLPFDTVTPDQAPDYPHLAVRLHRAQVDSLRWASVNELVFRAPDDTHTYRVHYFRPLTEQQEHDIWNGARAVELVEVEAVATTVTEWHPVGDKPAPSEDDGGSTPPADQFSESAVRRTTYLDAARETDDATKLFPDNLECAPAIGALQGLAQRLRRLAQHHTTAEQPAGLTWEARADHAVRLYARTAIELEDARAENTRLRAERTELIQQRDRIADDTVKALAAAPQTVTVAHVETALRSWLTDFDYDQHKALQCGEDDGEDRYPDEAEAFFGYLLAAVGMSA